MAQRAMPVYECRPKRLLARSAQSVRAITTMNKRLIFIIGGIIFLLAIWWLFRGKVPVASQPHPTSERPSTVEPPAEQATASSINQSVTPTAPTVPPVRKDKGELMRAAISLENAKPINVYGKVIDQYGQPVVGANVKGGTLLYVSIDKSGGQEIFTITDDQGRFSFTGLHGARFGFDLEKSGYEYDPRKYLDWWDSYKPDANNPAIFTMWKLKGAEPMVHIEAHCGLAGDGTVTGFDLLTGKKASDSGDVVIGFVRNPVNIDRSKPFDWTLTLQISGGGLIPIESVYANEAPAEGYQSSVIVNMTASEKNWSPSFVQSYYFKARNGQIYGKITVNLMANYQPPPTRFEIEIFTNPKPGSRNLEFDPQKLAASPTR